MLSDFPKTAVSKSLMKEVFPVAGASRPAVPAPTARWEPVVFRSSCGRRSWSVSWATLPPQGAGTSNSPALTSDGATGVTSIGPAADGDGAVAVTDRQSCGRGEDLRQQTSVSWLCVQNSLCGSESDRREVTRGVTGDRRPVKAGWGSRADVKPSQEEWRR